MEEKFANHIPHKGFPGGASGKELMCQSRRHKRCWFSPRVRKIPWRRKWHPTPVFLLGESHGQKSLADYSPWDLLRVGHDWASENISCKRVLSIFQFFFLFDYLTLLRPHLLLKLPHIIWGYENIHNIQNTL